jgi:hypothetical protein
MHNSSAGRVVARMVEKYTGWRRLVASHQGDDSREVWSNVMAGPLAQAILDAGGQVGQAEKQHFARETGSWAEFLRVWYRGGVTRGSSLRVIGGFVSSDSQHAAHEGGAEMVKTIVTTINDVWRRQGGSVKWRRADISAMLTYWSTSNEEFRLRGEIDWRGLISERFGMAVAAYPEMQWIAEGGEMIRRTRHKIEIGRHMLKRARRNLQAVGRVPGIGDYAEGYAKDMVASGVEHSTDVKGIKVRQDVPCGEHEYEKEAHDMLQIGASRVVDRCLKGALGWVNKDEFSVQVVVNHLFGGSETVARAYVRDNEYISLRGSARLRDNLRRGLSLMAGRTSMDKPKLRQDLVCAKKYWPHVESFLRDKPSCIHAQRWLGFLVARRAMDQGELI